MTPGTKCNLALGTFDVALHVGTLAAVLWYGLLMRRMKARLIARTEQFASTVVPDRK